MANVKISNLTAAASVSATNEFEINEAGVSKKVTAAQIAAYTNSLFTLGALASQGDGDKGDITVSASGATWTIDNGTIGTTKVADDAITYAKIQNVSATAKILGRKTAGAGDIEECSLTEVLDLVGSAAQGDLLYRNGSSWTRLGAGTSGQYLKTQGAAADPVWATVPTGGFTLLGTITTTSGTSQTLSSLTLTDYKFLLCVITGVSSSGTTGTLRIADPDTTALSLITVAGTASNRISGGVWIDLSTGALWGQGAPNAASTTPSVGTGNGNFGGMTTFSTAATSVTFSLSTGNFDAGSIKVYGVK